MTDTSTPSPLILSDKAYNRAKWLTVIVLPACGTLYFALAQTWGLPSGEQVLGTIVAVQAFIGVVLGISTVQYNNDDSRFAGNINIIQAPATGEKAVTVDFNDHPRELEGQKEAKFKVNGP
jgi:hypothetical protein